MINKIKKFLGDPYYVLGNYMMKHCPKLMPDRYFLKVKWKRCMGYELALDCPETFNEKLQWLKLYDRKPIYTTMVDKLRAKQWIADRIGEQYVIPTLAVYDSVDKIDLDMLPDKFVLKCNHDCGSVVICKDKSTFDIDLAKKKLGEALKKNYYWNSREWPYKNVKRCVFAEKYLEEQGMEAPADYKFYCFAGEPRLFYVTSDKGGDLPVRQDFFDIKGSHLEIQDKHYSNNPKMVPNLPMDLAEMVVLCRQLSDGIPHLRVDFYELNKTIYIGELTLYEAAGFCEFKPDKYNKILGDWIKLPTDK